MLAFLVLILLLLAYCYLVYRMEKWTAWALGPITRIIIDRYIGHFLKSDISTDSFKLQLREGAASIEGVQLSTEVCSFLLNAFIRLILAAS